MVATGQERPRGAAPLDCIVMYTYVYSCTARPLLACSLGAFMLYLAAAVNIAMRICYLDWCETMTETTGHLSSCGCARALCHVRVIPATLLNGRTHSTHDTT